MARIIVGVVVTIAVVILGNIFFPVSQAAIEVAAEPIMQIGSVPITNSLFTSILLSIVLLVAAFFIGRNLKEQPTGLQNAVEILIDALDNLVNSIAPKKWVPTFFPILATIFIYLVFANWISLLTPFLGSFGFVHPAEQDGIELNKVLFIRGGPESIHFTEEEGEGQEPEVAAERNVKIVPLFRAPSSDLNLTSSLALISVILTQIFGVWERGIAYFGNFIRVNAFKKGFLMGLIDFVIGLIEGLSEMAKVISFSFRLFGNIFAGEVVLIVISSLVSFLLVIVFFGFEIFVGVIQAFVFCVLSLVFFTLATQHHGEEEH